MFWPFSKSKTPEIPLRPARKADYGILNDLYDAAFAAVSTFDDYIDCHPVNMEIRDALCLPLPKDVLIRAFRIELSFEERSGIRHFLIELGLQLAYFRPDIGARTLSPFPQAARDRFRLGDDCAPEVLVTDYLPDYCRFRLHYDLALEEMGQLGTLFDQSIAVAKRRKKAAV